MMRFPCIQTIRRLEDGPVAFGDLDLDLDRRNNLVANLV